MALTKCIECGQELSTAAIPPCLHCGYPEPFLTKTEKQLKELEKKYDKKKKLHDEKYSLELEQLNLDIKNAAKAIKRRGDKISRSFFLMIAIIILFIDSLGNIQIEALDSFRTPLVFLIIISLCLLYIKSNIKKNEASSDRIDDYLEQIEQIRNEERKEYENYRDERNKLF